MTFEALNEEERAGLWLFLHANPIGVNGDTLQENGSWSKALSGVPENLRRLLLSEKTSSQIYLTAQEANLSDAQLEIPARTVRRVILGEISSSTLQSLLASSLEVPESTAQYLATRITKDFLAPNYFQISQLHERKQKSNSAESQRSASPETNLPHNVVDLRSARPSPRTPLPPPPPQVPGPNDEPPDNFPTPA